LVETGRLEEGGVTPGRGAMRQPSAAVRHG
jgi:hypothetical protein